MHGWKRVSFAAPLTIVQRNCAKAVKGPSLVAIYSAVWTVDLLYICYLDRGIAGGSFCTCKLHRNGKIDVCKLLQDRGYSLCISHP